MGEELGAPAFRLGKKALVAAAIGVALLAGGGAGYANHQQQVAEERAAVEAARIAAEKAAALKAERIAEAQQLDSLAEDLQGAWAEYEAVIASLEAKGEDNAQTLQQWDRTWNQRLSAYSQRKQEVADHNTEEERRYRRSGVPATIDPFTMQPIYSDVRTYTMNKWSAPPYPGKPAKVKADISSEQSRLAELATVLTTTTATLTTPTVGWAHFPAVAEALSTAAVELAAQAGQLEAATKKCMTADPERGDVLKTKDIDAMKSGAWDSLMQQAADEFDRVLGQYSLAREDVTPAEDSATVGSRSLLK